MPDIKTLILENEKLIYKAASYFTQYNKDDLFQAGAIGMIMAYQKFDESRA